MIVRLLFKTENMIGIHEHQFGFRKGNSIIQALELVIKKRIHTESNGAILPFTVS